MAAFQHRLTHALGPPVERRTGGHSATRRAIARLDCAVMRQSPIDPIARPPMSDGPAPEIRDGELLAAVDLGSNSFHLVVARYEHGELRVIDRLRDSVRLAAGLRADGSLDEGRRDKALACLAP